MTNVRSTTDTAAVSLADECRDVQHACYRAAVHCISAGEPLADPDRIRLLFDTADIAHVMSSMLIRSSIFYRATGKLLMASARATGHALEAFDHEDEQLRSAYVLCQRIRVSCGEFLGDVDAAEYDEQDLAVKNTFPASDPPQRGSEV
jgi:hypothetical protein